MVLCSSNGDAQEKWKTGWNSVYHKNWWFSDATDIRTYFTDNAICRLTLEMTGLVISSLNMSVRRWDIKIMHNLLASYQWQKCEDLLGIRIWHSGRFLEASDNRFRFFS
jgi:hypothetical protein